MDENYSGDYFGQGIDDEGTPPSSSSPSFLDYLNWGGSTATGLLGALNRSRAATAPKPTTPNWGVIAGIAAAVVLVLVLVLSLGRK